MNVMKMIMSAILLVLVILKGSSSAQSYPGHVGSEFTGYHWYDAFIQLEDDMAIGRSEIRIGQPTPVTPQELNSYYYGMNRFTQPWPDNETYQNGEPLEWRYHGRVYVTKQEDHKFEWRSSFPLAPSGEPQNFIVAYYEGFEARLHDSWNSDQFLKEVNVLRRLEYCYSESPSGESSIDGYDFDRWDDNYDYSTGLAFDNRTNVNNPMFTDGYISNSWSEIFWFQLNGYAQCGDYIWVPPSNSDYQVWGTGSYPDRMLLSPRTVLFNDFKNVTHQSNYPQYDLIIFYEDNPMYGLDAFTAIPARCYGTPVYDMLDGVLTYLPQSVTTNINKYGKKKVHASSQEAWDHIAQYYEYIDAFSIWVDDETTGW